MTGWTRGRPWLPWGAAALGVGVLAVLVILGGHQQSHKPLNAALIAVVGWSFALGGCLAWARRPENRTGRLLLVVAFCWFAPALTAANDATLYTIGNLLGALGLAAFVHLLLAYPSGDLRSRLERGVVVTAYVLAVLANAGPLFFDPHPNCGDCPQNVLFVRHAPGLADALTVAADIAGVVLLVGVVIALARHWRGATAAARRGLTWILAAGGAALLLVAAGFAADPVSSTVRNVLEALGLIVFASVPFIVLVGLLRSRLARGGVGELLLEVRETASMEEAQASLRRVLGDPDLQLAVWLPERQSYVASDGHPFPLTPGSRNRVTSPIEDERGNPVAVLVHDRALLLERELLAGVMAAARLALQRNRLQTELRARLDELQRERDFIAKVVNSAPTYFCVLEPDGSIVRFNETLVAASGTADDEAVRGRPFWEVFPVPEDAGAVREALLAAGPEEHQHRWRSADGGEIVVAWSVTSLVDAQDQPRLLATGLDVTHRVIQEDELRRQRDFLSTVGYHTPSLLCVVDAEGIVDAAGVNRGFAEATGFDDDGAVGRSFFELVIPSEHKDAARQALRDAIEKSEPVRVETPWHSADGSPLLVEWWAGSLSDWREDMYLICGVDVTERKRQEVELRRSRSRIVEAQDAERRRLERNLHDGAQQRLVSLSLAIRLAQAKLASDPEGADEILSSASVELAFALQELRELARGLHPAILSDRGLAAALESLAERSPVPVELEIDADDRLPGQVEVGAFYVVSEALANMAKYAHATTAKVRVRRQNGDVLVEVIDDGIGGADLARGTGLRGLVDRVDSLDGRLEVSSPPGGGTRIAAEIPLGPVREAVPQDAG